MTLFGRNTLFKILDRYLNQALYEDAIQLMSPWQDAYLGLFEEAYPHHRVTLSQECFAPYWAARRERIIIRERPGFHFVAQKNRLDMDIVVGHVFYLLALKSSKKGDEDESRRYLDQAISHSSFHAVARRLKQIATVDPSAKEATLTQLADALLTFHSFAEQCGCPGYLLLVDGYLHLATERLALADAAASAKDFALVWKYLQLARLSEDNSSAEIHNAYFGQGLVSSNAFNFETMEQIIEGCKTIAGDALTLLDQNFIKHEAAREYQMIVTAQAVDSLKL